MHISPSKSAVPLCIRSQEVLNRGVPATILLLSALLLGSFGTGSFQLRSAALVQRRAGRLSQSERIARYLRHRRRDGDRRGGVRRERVRRTESCGAVSGRTAVVGGGGLDAAAGREAGAVAASHHAAPELAGHEAVDDGVQAAVHERQQVEEYAHGVHAVVEHIEAALDDNFHDEPGAPAKQEEDHHKDEHLDDLLACSLDVSYVGVGMAPKDEPAVRLLLCWTGKRTQSGRRGSLALVTKLCGLSELVHGLCADPQF